ncbi:F-box/FBD/LRR-repeat protein At5g22700-like [Silene latifolia]|uniref:F-box/FBD/LRR-repeat protein At5g22700-like n=1 Tax=Silene latifolia TaxID=37657 RepID=UPI003D787268
MDCSIPDFRNPRNLGVDSREESEREIDGSTPRVKRASLNSEEGNISRLLVISPRMIEKTEKEFLILIKYTNSCSRQYYAYHFRISVTDRRILCYEARCKDDLLSELPDDILVSIISLITTKDAARLSLVSRQYEFISRSNFPVLIFEDFEDQAKEKTASFVSRVDCVLEKHLGKIIDEFRITFDLDRIWQSHVNNWVTIALDKKVKRIELNFSTPIRGKRRVDDDYIYRTPLDLPIKFTNGRFKSNLTSLCLRYVNVTDEFVDNLPNSCPFLEILCIEGSGCLTRITGSLDLKHLEASYCCNLKKIDISARKLQSFTLNSMFPIEPRIVDAPFLVKMSIGEEQTLPYAFEHLDDIMSRLVYLKLRIDLTRPFFWFEEVITEERRERAVDIWLGISSRLKTLELVGYRGKAVDLEVAIFVLENSPVLEEVIVDFAPLINDKADKRERLLPLKRKLPRGVKLTIK